jgi:hypothetical protein
LESSWCNREQYLLVVVALEDRHDNERTAKKEVVNANRDQTTTVTILATNDSVSGWTWLWLTSKVGFLWNRVNLIDEEDCVMKL